MKKILGLSMAVILSLGLVACNDAKVQQSAKGNDQTKQEEKQEKSIENGTVYTVDGATTEESGITQTIKEVRVFDNMTDAVKSYNQSEAVISDENKDKLTVVVTFKVKNDNKFKISTYPCQATFITNTGEQVDADVWASESFDGDIYEGVTTEGHVLFNLDKTPIDELESFKMAWSTSHDNGTADNYDDDYYKDNKLEVTLK